MRLSLFSATVSLMMVMQPITAQPSDNGVREHRVETLGSSGLRVANELSPQPISTEVKAIEAYSRLIDKDPEDRDSCKERAKAYQDLGQYQKAEEDYSQVIRLTRDDANRATQECAMAYIDRANMYKWQALMQRDKVIDDCDRAANSDGYASRYENADHEYRQTINRAIDDYSRAINLMPKSLWLLGPGKESLYENRAGLFQNLHQYENAIDDLTRAIALDPDNASSYGTRAAMFATAKRYQEAVADYSKVISLDSKVASDAEIAVAARVPYDNDLQLIFRRSVSGSYVQRASVYISMRQFRNAVEDCCQAINITPEPRDDAYTTRAKAYAGMGNSQQALADYDKAIAICCQRIKRDSNSSFSYFMRADTYADMKNFRKAIEDYTQAIKLAGFGDLELPYHGRAKAYWELGQVNNVIADCSNAISHSSGIAPTTYNLRGQAYKKLGKWDLANRDFATARLLGYESGD